MDFIERDAKEIFEEEFLEYAGYNLQRRAIPDVRDGLKWGARKLLHSQSLIHLTYDKPYKKAAKSVAQATSFSYLNGDASAYGTFIRMAKPFAYRVPLQDANGNFGTIISPNDHAASRYVELRGSEAAAALLKDIDKDTITEWEETYDREGQFPKVLPAKGFWNGVNGCISIGSGMSSSLPPLNLIEVNEAMIKLLWNPEEDVLCYPDFPTGATILNKTAITDSLRQGTGAACKVRATVEWDEKEQCFVVKELPYSVYTNTICSELATLIETDENCGIRDFVDYTGEFPDIHIFLAKGARPDKVLRLLYKMTSLQTFFSINMTVLDKGIKPVIMGQKEQFLAHLSHEKEVYIRGFNFDLRKIRARLHILDALMRAYDAIDEVIHTIKSATSAQVANVALRKLLSIDEEQAKAILDLKLARLSKLDIEKLREEQAGLLAEDKRISAILEDEFLLKKEIEKGLREVAEKFGDARRTKILDLQEDTEGETIEVKQQSLTLTSRGTLFAAETSTLLTQRRGTLGTRFKLAKDEYVVGSVVGDNVDEVLFFTDNGLFYHKRMGDFAVGEKSSADFIKGDEKIVAMTVLKKETSGSIIFFTRGGLMKKSSLTDYNLARGNGAKAIALEPNDRIVSVIIGEIKKVGILTKGARIAIIDVESAREIGRVSKGIAAVRLEEGDEVISVRSLPQGTKQILSISACGLAKRTSFFEFNEVSRGAKGQRVQIADEMADFYPLCDEAKINILGTNSQICVEIEEIPVLGRATKGVKLLKLKENEKVRGIKF